MVRASALKNGTSTSCGCLRVELTVERSRTHGMTKSREYETWHRMKQRCLDKNNEHYKDYGARGIRVCFRWLNSFEAFLEDMGPRPGAGYSIERKRVNDDYQPDNCIWATIDVQNRNKRSNVFLEHDGQHKTVAEWARDLGLTQTALHDRLKRGWSIEETVTTGRTSRWRRA